MQGTGLDPGSLAGAADTGTAFTRTDSLQVDRTGSPTPGKPQDKLVGASVVSHKVAGGKPARCFQSINSPLILACYSGMVRVCPI